MSRFEDACPIQATMRASRCESCVAANNVPPCVAVYLGGRQQKSNLVPLYRVELVESRKAA